MWRRFSDHIDAMLLRRLAPSVPRPPAAPLPSSPFAFFQENEILRHGLVWLNVIACVYCIAASDLLSRTTCQLTPLVSFHCTSAIAMTPYSRVLLCIHVLSIGVFMVIAMALCCRPRGCVVKFNAVCLAVAGIAMAALGVQQCALANESPRKLLSILTGLLMLVVTGILTSGSFAARCYAKRLNTETRVIVEVILNPAN